MIFNTVNSNYYALDHVVQNFGLFFPWKEILEAEIVECVEYIVKQLKKENNIWCCKVFNE